MKLEKGKITKSTRDAYGDVLVEIAEKYPEIVVLDADLSGSTMTCRFAKKFPERFYNMGIAEQSMLGTAAGFATCGKTAICSTFAVFASLRAGEQIRTSVCYPRLNVKIITTHSGLSIGTAGATHFCEEDFAVMRALPNMTVIAPSDWLETKKAVEAAVKIDGPVYIRLGRGDAAVIYEELDDYEIGKAITLHEGNDVTIIGTGVMVQRAVAAAEVLKESNIQCRVLDMHTIKPIDADAVKKAALETKAIITLEEHNIYGGLGSAVAEIIAGIKGEKATLKILGIPDVFGGVASAEVQWDAFGMTAENVAQIAKELIK